ncbi:hypothetical protein IE53DRAFT_387923 [Violaceomyces palustris]|uniref:Uncharacterized protein n=1 Tax=Violaceomyces palustris TaxID=1673888 RepID=A0ACD0NVJ5_9BASI|nr:hypothetical protein IE53DRAFT_387923 [Violaceomyces palustris]
MEPLQPVLTLESSSVTTEAIRSLTPDTIAFEIRRFQNSISHLLRSNAEMLQMTQQDQQDSGLDQGDREMLLVACRENQEVCSRQRDLIERLSLVLREKVGSSHYGATVPDDQLTLTSYQQSDKVGQEEEAQTNHIASGDLGVVDEQGTLYL